MNKSAILWFELHTFVTPLMKGQARNVWRGTHITIYKITKIVRAL